MQPPSTRIAVNGYAVCAIRTLAGLGRSTVAREAGLDASYLSRIESGQRTQMSAEKFAALARVFATHGVDRRALLALPVDTTNEAAA